MKNSIRWIFPFMVLFLMTGAMPREEAIVADEQLRVITNGGDKVMTFKSLKKIMRGEKQRWSDGKKVTIALLKTNTGVGELTAKKVYGMSPGQLNKYWLGLVFQGRAEAPHFFISEELLILYVNSTPGAIGIISTDPDSSDNLATVDGKKVF